MDRTTRPWSRGGPAMGFALASDASVPPLERAEASVGSAGYDWVFL